MDDARRARLLAYCRLDDLTPEDLDLLASMEDAARAYLLGAGVPEPTGGLYSAALYESVVNALVLDDWDNRGSQTAGYTITENPAFRRKLNQLKLTVPILGTEV